MLSPLIVFTVSKAWTISEILAGFYHASDLRKCCTASKYGLNEQNGRDDDHVEEHWSHLSGRRISEQQVWDTVWDQ